MSKVVKVKVCGITRACDAKLAIELGVWAIGFIFYPKSPRFIQAIEVKSIIQELSGLPKLTVGVFVNPTLEELKAVVPASGINAIQLHGNETPEFCASLKASFPGITIIKAMRLGESTEPVASIDCYLLDSQSETEWGGTGKSVNWEAAAKINLNPLILAGGLTAKNISEALRIVDPEGVDISSGVETTPGIKSEEKLRDFFQAMKVKS